MLYLNIEKFSSTKQSKHRSSRKAKFATTNKARRYSTQHVLLKRNRPQRNWGMKSKPMPLCKTGKLKVWNGLGNSRLGIRFLFGGTLTWGDEFISLSSCWLKAELDPLFYLTAVLYGQFWEKKRGKPTRISLELLNRRNMHDSHYSQTTITNFIKFL